MPENISPHCTYKQATQSQTATRLGLTNEPGHKELTAMKLVAAACYEPAVAHFGPIPISSFFRSHKVNAAIGGALTSQHIDGEAMDLDLGNQNTNLLKWLRANTPFDQIISEYEDSHGVPSWVHVSHKATGNRGAVLRAIRINGKTVYRPYDVRPA